MRNKPPSFTYVTEFEKRISKWSSNFETFPKEFAKEVSELQDDLKLLKKKLFQIKKNSNLDEI